MPTPFPIVSIGNDQYGWGLREVTSLGHQYMPVRIRRGFVEEVTIPDRLFYGGRCLVCGVRNTAPSFRDSGPCPRCHRPYGTEGEVPSLIDPIFRNHPVTLVRATDKYPSEWVADLGDRREFVFERDMSDQPLPDDDSWSYLGIGPFATAGTSAADSLIHHEVFDLMEGQSGGYYPVIGKHGSRRYDSRLDAWRDYWKACARYARGRVGLPTHWEQP